MHTPLTVLSAYLRAQGSQLSSANTPVELDLDVHSHFMEGHLPVGIGGLRGIAGSEAQGTEQVLIRKLQI